MHVAFFRMLISVHNSKQMVYIVLTLATSVVSLGGFG